MFLISSQVTQLRLTYVLRKVRRHVFKAYEGVVVDRSNGGIGATFTVRKISNGVGVQRTFPVHSPIIEKIEVVR